jgi:membrane-bound lytic murein transglycosylase D
MNLEKSCRMVVIGILLLGWMVHFGQRAWGEGASAPVQSPIVVPYFAPPDQMDLCGERVPIHIPEVRERLDREFTLVVYSHAQVYLWLKRMDRYFPWLEKELARRNLPEDLKFVAVAESDLIVSACSPAGAVGPWQFIKSTGANYGLNQSSSIDERMDFEMATESAFRYLQNLQQIFSNWTLAIAAYNCGERRVQDEMRKQKADNYYALKLPLETERYILRIISIKEVLKNPERYGYSLPKDAGYPPLKVDRVNIRLSNPTPVISLAEAAGVTYREFKTLNPILISDTAPEGAIALKLPLGKGKEFESRFESMKPERPERLEKPEKLENKTRLIHHKVGRGETLSGIAARYGVSEHNVVEWNQMKGKAVRKDQVLKIMK